MTGTSQQAARAELMALIAPSWTLPEFEGWTIAADFAVLIARYILDTRPAMVLELGSGLSSLVIGHALRKAGKGRLISLEHEMEYYEKTRQLITAHELNAVIDLMYCPLVPCQTPLGEQPWYDIPALAQPIDLLVVDGPPGAICAKARYPALPLLWEHLGKEAVIMLDDAGRADETVTYEEWRKNYPQLTCELLPTEKGTGVLRRSGR